ncbi:dTDP-4-dehydrorhamnose reductase [Sulfurirhabdus autotrophica]|uniref:dTDP-4-dehydrorhamnose reductase n=1 Tax=Sulfurirhabdus autotrophica TaxID=1706046 RepID=A0A4R3Y1X9_9PROT|nr:dTDP-4-dehydrorhamnose reductase [Sulfurirhabdus autotrophica]TCV84254.1 dTDP-4-dehydrorhamnose reductase [Sulfurirhabdus autotrophica]
MKILLIGKNGQVGWELQRTLATLGDVIPVDRNQMDLANPDSIRAVIREAKPDIIVNAAAYTAVDKAESEPELAMAINGVAPGIMAEEAKRLNALVVHYSTDYVFDGTKQGAYTEEDIPNPINVYGKTKLAGEQAVQAVDVQHIILRTSWVYGVRGKNFLLTILRLAKERDELKIVDDQIGAPTWSRMIAEATGQILAQKLSPFSINQHSFSELYGVYHLTSGGQTTWYGFTKAILQHQSVIDCGLLPKLIPISTKEYPLPAKRPENSVLSSGSLIKTFGLTLPVWDRALSICLDEINF